MATIRQATLQDIGLIHELATNTWFRTYQDILSPEQANYMFEWMYSEASLRQQLEIEGHRFFLAYDREKPVGYVSIGKQDEGLFHLHKLYILPEHQGDGTGKLLMNTAFEYAKQASEGKACSVELNVNRNNNAVSFYKKMGMYVHQEGDFDIGSGYQMNDFIMRIDL
jgi:ribosomal protein S18 acetylase RimI-like enzyme